MSLQAPTEPVFAAIFAASFFGERMTPRELLGAALILAGVFVSELWRPAVAWFSGQGSGATSSPPRATSETGAEPPEDRAP